MKALLTLLLLLLSASSVSAAQIAHAVQVVTTKPTDTTSTTYVDVPGAALASNWSGATLSSGTGFTVGKKYLIVVNAQVYNGSNAQIFYKTLHGSTDFTGSEMVAKTHSNLVAASYNFMTVWTAVSGEGIKMQWHCATCGTARIDTISIMAINLSDDVAENTDWFFAEDTTTTALTGTPADGASITFTPGTAGRDWLVMSVAQYRHSTPDSGTVQAQTRLNASGTITSTVPQANVTQSTSDKSMLSLSRVYKNLGSISQTIKEQSSENGADRSRLYSAIFAIDLGKFAGSATAYTEADTAILSTPYGNTIATVSVTPTVISNVWVGGHWTFKPQSADRKAQYRLQVDSSDVPTGQTTDALSYRYTASVSDNADPMSINTITNLSNAAHTVNIDASADSVVGSPQANTRSVWAVPMELVDGGGGGGGTPSTRGLLGVGK